MMEREEGKERLESVTKKLFSSASCSIRKRVAEGEENHETIGEAEAAAFHVAWHRLPLKSLLLFVSSSKIMIVCPRDLLLGGSPDAPRARACACMHACVCGRVCAQGALEEHRDLSLVFRSGDDRNAGGLPRLKNREFTALATKPGAPRTLLPSLFLALPLSSSCYLNLLN